MLIIMCIRERNMHLLNLYSVPGIVEVAFIHVISLNHHYYIVSWVLFREYSHDEGSSWLIKCSTTMAISWRSELAHASRSQINKMACVIGTHLVCLSHHGWMAVRYQRQIIMHKFQNRFPRTSLVLLNSSYIPRLLNN